MKKNNNKFWKEYFEIYDVLNKLIPYQELMRRVCDELKLVANDLVLEAGSGTGNLSILFKKIGANVISLDKINEGLIREKMKDPNAKVVLCDLTENLPFEDNKFDKISLVNVLYSISPEKRLRVLKELQRILKPKGYIVIVNPFMGSSPIKIYLDHILKSMKLNGWLKTLLDFIIFSKIIIKMFFYNLLIRKNFHFFIPDEQSRYIRDAGFSYISDPIKVYSGQAILTLAKK